MSILKSNSASIVNEPITVEWLKTTCFFDRIIPVGALKYRSGSYCTLSKSIKKYPIGMGFSIEEAFAPEVTWAFSWEDLHTVIPTKTIWTPKGVNPILSRKLETKGDVIKFIEDVRKTLDAVWDIKIGNHEHSEIQ